MCPYQLDQLAQPLYTLPASIRQESSWKPCTFALLARQNTGRSACHGHHWQPAVTGLTDMFLYLAKLDVAGMQAKFQQTYPPLTVL